MGIALDSTLHTGAVAVNAGEFAAYAACSITI